MAPRPATKSSNFVLIDDSGGGRVLEGIQDVFLIVNLPKKLGGFCVQASVDTGHKVMANNMMFMENERQPNGEEEHDGGEGGGGGETPTAPPGQTYNQLIVTRRIVQNCGKFDDNGNFAVTGVPNGGTGTPAGGGVVVWEDSHLTPKINPDLSSTTTDIVAKQVNLGQSRFMKSMISGFSSGNFSPVEFTKTKTFRRQVRQSLRRLPNPIEKLVELNYLTAQERTYLIERQFRMVGDIFNSENSHYGEPRLIEIRKKILEKDWH